MPLCRICKESALDGINLSNGEIIHESCLESIQAKELEIRNQIDEQLRIRNSLINEIKRRKGLLFKFVSKFTKPTSNIAEIEKKIYFVVTKAYQLSSSLYSLKKIVTDIYDYFLTYPPDWDKRRKKVAERDGEQCNDCRNLTYLHLHHVVPLSRGGDNRLENLELLCEKCHSRRHSIRHFPPEIIKNETAFSKRVSNIRYAIINRRRIKFGYKKPTDEHHQQRTVNPTELINIPHATNNGSTLCVRGYCELRNAERTFALKRMRGLKVIQV